MLLLRWSPRDYVYDLDEIVRKTGGAKRASLGWRVRERDKKRQVRHRVMRNRNDIRLLVEIIVPRYTM